MSTKLFAVYRNENVVSVEMNYRKARREVDKFINDLDWELVCADQIQFG